MKTMSKLSLAFTGLTLALLQGCATYRPILDENSHYAKVGEAQAERDIDMCLQKADTYLAKHKEEKMRKEMGRSAVTGAAVGGVIGLVAGGSVTSTVVGAGVGAGAGAVGAYASEKSKDQLKPDELKQRYVNNCLARKRYAVIGWK